jgi:hypothetical protein
MVYIRTTEYTLQIGNLNLCSIVNITCSRVVQCLGIMVCGVFINFFFFWYVRVHCVV